VIDEPDGYTIVLSPGARRALSDSLPSSAAFAAWEFIRGPLAERPRVVGAPLRVPVEGLWRARRGEYRVRYRIEEEHRRIVVLSVEHRRSAYRS
jgi:mRNA interferase RelE/StbE